MAIDINREPQQLSEVIQENLRKIEHGGFPGVPSGFVELDRITSGWQKSELIVIAGRPAMGKTAFVLSCVRNAVVDFAKPTVVFSLESSSVQLVNRLISAEAEIEQDKIRKGALEEWEWQLIHSKIPVLEQAPLIIDDTPALDIAELEKKCRDLKEKHDIQLIVVDYLQLLKSKGADGKGIADRYNEIGYITRGLKSIAKELNVPVIALSQLSRSVESRPGGSKRPMLSDLPESSSIEQDADMILFLYRPEYYGLEVDEDNNSTQGVGEVIIAKNRNGETGRVRLKFVGKYVKFTDLEQDENSFETSNPFGRLNPSKKIDKQSSFFIRPSRMDDLEDEPPF